MLHRIRRPTINRTQSIVACVAVLTCDRLHQITRAEHDAADVEGDVRQHAGGENRAAGHGQERVELFIVGDCVHDVPRANHVAIKVGIVGSVITRRVAR